MASRHVYTLKRPASWYGDPGRELPDVTSTFAEMRRAIDAGDYAAANQDNLGAALRQKGYGAKVEVPYPLGWLTMSFTPETAFRHYRRGVDMRVGEAFVDFEIGGCGYHRRLFVSRADDIAVLRMFADRPFAAAFVFKLFDYSARD